MRSRGMLREDAVFDALAQSAAELSDEEVAGEYREDGEELSAVATRVRSVLSAAVGELMMAQGGLRGPRPAGCDDA